MTEEEQRIAIAEFLDYLPSTGAYTPGCSWIKDGKCHVLPDYLHDLNAMHEAESKLPIELRYTYVETLGGLAAKDYRGYLWRITSATSVQRAEALLLTIGKWKD